MNDKNPIGLNGIEFIEFSSSDPGKLDQLFVEFGFSRVMCHQSKKIDYFKQNDIHFLVNREPVSFAQKFTKDHGPCISSMGWRVRNAAEAHRIALKRGAVDGTLEGDYHAVGSKPIPAVKGIGESLIYFIEPSRGGGNVYQDMGFIAHPQAKVVAEKGFLEVDHLTNNVYKGTMEKWSNFYKDVFAFTEVRYFDIRGVKTGLTSYALRSACGKFCIPINEGTEKKSQINEYLDEYKGPGVQHLAFSTDNIVASLKSLSGSSIETLDIGDDYYDEVFDRVPNVTEDREALKKFQILVDGDEEGYLLQIFTKNIIGPIFIEIIQRKNNLSFGEGNFGALFRAIERDQEKRGYL